MQMLGSRGGSAGFSGDRAPAQQPAAAAAGGGGSSAADFDDDIPF